MVDAATFSSDTSAIIDAFETPLEFNFQLPDPEDETIQDHDFQQQLDSFWQVCDRLAIPKSSSRSQSIDFSRTCHRSHSSDDTLRTCHQSHSPQCFP